MSLPIIGFEHVGVAVTDIDAALATYGRLGFRRVSVEDLADQGIRSHVIELGRIQIELLESTTPDGVLADFLAERGPGLHHLCLRVSSIAAAVEHLDALGDTRATEPAEDRRGTRVFIHPRAAEDVLIGLVEVSAEATDI